MKNLVKLLKINKHKVLAERVLAAESYINFDSFYKGQIKIDLKISDFEQAIPKLDFSKINEYKEVQKIQKPLSENMNERLTKIREVFINLVENILTEVADEYAEKMRPYV